MKSETKNCQNCQKDFILEAEDFNFYEKIKVPPPTFCPSCRFQRRMAWRNDWHLFKKKDALTGKEIFSFLPEESPVKIYDRDYWISDAWDPMEYGQDYDFKRPFFEQFKDLLYRVPLPAHSMVYVTNCRYCANANSIKNCYLVRAASYTEDSAYLIWDGGSRECFDSHMTNKCELSYGNVNTATCYRTFFSVDCESCQEIILCKDCVGCNNCLASVGLRNKSYCIFNQQYAKEEYVKKINEFNLGSDKSFQSLKIQAYEYWLNFPQKYIHGRQNIKVSGDYIYESKNAVNCFRVVGVEDSKFVQNILDIGSVKDCYDYSNFGQNAELIYESLVVGIGASNVKFSAQTYPNAKNMTYCIFCNNSSDLFGCVSLRKKQYCILNKQYTKEEYEKIREHIINELKEKDLYGLMMPQEIAPFAYNESIAHDNFPLTEQEALAQGFRWEDDLQKTEGKETIQPTKIPDCVKDILDSITEEILKCIDCNRNYKITEQELLFYKKMNIPLPRECFYCRHQNRIIRRGPYKFWDRQCAKCGKEITANYAPDRPEIVYCEKCYQQEVY
jgi:hypothetical protein